MLVILTTHPIQYQVPIWQQMAKENGLSFEVWYLTRHGVTESYDRQFGQTFAWNIDLLSGYPYTFLEGNKGTHPGDFVNVRLPGDFKSLLQVKKVRMLWVNGWQVLAYWQAVWTAHKLGIKICLRAETNDLKPDTWWKYIPRKMLLNQFFKRISFFLYIGKANRRFYHQFGIDNSELLPAHYCVDNDRFAHQSSLHHTNLNRLRAKWQIPDDAFCLLFSGKFIEKKRPYDIIKAVNFLNGDIKRRIHLLFVGSGELEKQLKESCHVTYPMPNSGRVNKDVVDKPTASFTGFINQSEIVEAYAVADCLILPSNYLETWGLVVNEAMACGTPCISSDLCGCSEDLVKPIGSNLVFECGNISDLSAAIKFVMTKPPKTVAIKKRIDKYSISVTIKSINKIYGKDITNVTK